MLPVPHAPRRASGAAVADVEVASGDAGEESAGRRRVIAERRVRDHEALPVALGRVRDEAEDLREHRGGGRGIALDDAGAVQAADLALDRHRAGLPRREAAPDGGRRLDQRDAQAVRVDDRQRALAEPRLDRARRWRRSRSGARPTSRACPAGTASDTSVASPWPSRDGAMCAQGKNVRSVPACPSASA